MSLGPVRPFGDGPGRDLLSSVGRYGVQMTLSESASRPPLLCVTRLLKNFFVGRPLWIGITTKVSTQESWAVTAGVKVSVAAWGPLADDGPSEPRVARMAAAFALSSSRPTSGSGRFSW